MGGGGVKEIHPPAATLQRFVRGDLDRVEVRKVVRHLLAGCSRCRGAVRGAWQRSAGRGRARERPAGRAERTETVHPAAYEEVWRHLLERQPEIEERMAQERREAPSLIEELLERPPEGRLGWIGRDRRFHTLAFCDRLLERSRQRRTEGAAAAVELAELALAVLEKLDERFYGASLLCGARARAWVHLAHARRLSADAAGAERAFQMAASVTEPRLADPWERVELLSLEALLRGDRGDHGGALARLDRAAVVARRSGDPHLLGKVILEKGAASAAAGNPAGAVVLLREGLDRIEAERDPELFFSGARWLVACLADSGRCGEAMLALARARPRLERYAGGAGRAHLRRVEGKLSLALDRRMEAEEALVEARITFLRHGLAHEAAVSLLDLAAVYARADDQDGLERLVSELPLVFASGEIQVDAVVALYVFERAAKGRCATHGLIQQLAAYLQHARLR